MVATFAFSRHDTKEFGIRMSGVGFYLFTPGPGFFGGFSLESKQVISCTLGVGKVYIYYMWGVSPLYRAHVPLIYKLNLIAYANKRKSWEDSSFRPLVLSYGRCLGGQVHMCNCWKGSCDV